MNTPSFRSNRWWRDLRYRMFYSLLLRPRPDLADLGGRIAWTIWPARLGPASVVISAGAGRDISFEHALADRFGCRVTLLDPSPTAQETMADPANRHARIDFLAEGLAAQAGALSFSAPLNPAEGSFTTARPGAAACTFPCTTLPALMQRLGVARVDLLKLDIEGFEYAVLDDLLARGLAVDQICVEYHHDQLPIPRAATLRSLLRLRRAGYRLVHVHGWDHTFVHRRAWRA